MRSATIIQLPTNYRNLYSAYFVHTVGVEFTVSGEPSDSNVEVGQSLTLSCTVTGSEPITYQWFKDGSELPGETEDMLAFMAVAYSDFGTYHCVVNNSVNTIQSREAVVTGLSSCIFVPHVIEDLALSRNEPLLVLSVSPDGSVSVNPSVLLANQTDNVTFTCGAMGGPGNTFQWSHNGQDLSGETTSTLTLTNISASDDGNYTCTVSNSAGSGSDVAMLIGMYSFYIGPCTCSRMHMQYL